MVVAIAFAAFVVTASPPPPAAASSTMSTATPTETSTSAGVDARPAAQALLAKYPGQKARIDRGLAQVQALWRADDGDANALRDFAMQHFVADDKDLDVTFHRLERALEAVDGHMLEIGRELRAPTELELPQLSPTTAVDDVLAGWDASAHVVDDWFANKLAFAVLLNFPQSTLADRIKAADKLSRRDWAVARLTGRFARRVPADVTSRQATVSAAADRYIADYNLWMHHVLDEHGQRVFPRDMKLISHWNLRDELKAQYANGADGTNRQRTIVKLMERIVTQTIPDAAIDAPGVDYNPFANTIVAAPADEAEKSAPADVAAVSATAVAGEDEIRRATNRYQQLLEQFRASAAADPYTPKTPNAILRSFELSRELPEERVQRLFLDVLESPLVPQVAAEIERRLGRKLEPQDLWYDGFKARSAISPDELDEKTRGRYPTADAYKADMPRMFRELGFSREKADWLASNIVVEPSRGAGHALQSARRGDVPHLRTRVGDKGMDYKGYNIAVHEMGHNVEQLFSLYEVDSTLLQGVPNNAFTEAIAFVFQARDLELLGLSKLSTEAKRESVLADFWATWEIAGVALVDVAVWHWMYAHPQATPAELRDATVTIASDIWKKHYAKVLGGVDKDGRATPLLGIYSHMIAYPLYLTDYPLGHLIAFQIEEQVDKATSSGKTTLGAEIERMCRVGAVAPDVWMKNASGQPVSAAPLLRATQNALSTLSSATK
jgi:hypothetical protein